MKNTFEILEQLILKNRSYRRFYQSEKVATEDLKSWINLARQSASARNLQTLKYIVVNTEEQCQQIFPLLSWAGYLKDWDAPEQGERPSAYIVVLNDNHLSEEYFSDDGIASQSILLGATACGYGGCIIAAVKRKELRSVLKIAPQYKIIQVIALGKPKEKVVLDEVGKDGDIKYWREKNGVHHVPKRKIDKLILKI